MKISKASQTCTQSLKETVNFMNSFPDLIQVGKKGGEKGD